ncbi:MAG: hypothetical protein II859_02985 [Bacteroidales bacterium]|nr:hypothetical protein [Bacteroidales bacterium]MBR0053685.1 hypothetical protein [Bacteroidales bacterium]
MEFRPMRRFKQQLLDEECVAILNEAYRGFLSVVGDGGYPEIVSQHPKARKENYYRIIK